VSILLDDQLRSTLRRAGLDNLAHYSWAPLQNAAREIANRFLRR
jgi:hypothetical protein